jgi:hypothetical protein
MSALGCRQPNAVAASKPDGNASNGLKATNLNVYPDVRFGDCARLCKLRYLRLAHVRADRSIAWIN